MKKLIVYLAVIFLFFGCFDQNNPLESEQNVAIQFMKSANIDVASAQCRVSSDDMDTIAVYLTATPTMISGEIPNVPFGNDRLFEIMCYSSTGIMNYYGSALVDINSMAPVVDIVLYPNNNEANVTIRGTFGDTTETESKIVFVADWVGNYNTYIMNSDGTNIKQLSFSDFNDNNPSLSPDRQKVVYQRQSQVGHQGFIVDVNTLEEVMLPLVDYCPHALSWHPDGRKLIFTSWINDNSDIFVYDLELDSVTCLIANSAVKWDPHYTQDGEHILYHSDITGVFRIYMINADGSNKQMLCTAQGVEERAVRMNPANSGEFVFAGRGYSETSYVQWGIFMLDRSTGNVQNIISTNHVDEIHPYCSPDGESILYEQFDGENRGLYLINKDGTQNRVLLDTNGNERYPFWR